MRWLFAVVAGMLIGVSAIATSPANAQPVPPPPPPTQPGSSSTEELADMVLDAIEQDSSAAPSTTPVPQP
ncbi:hypothetical protein [Mycolicibacterium gadium]|uniref:Uncharacterized protein n=1 Tax=Mycolicibacterium gadium TaxID=1794 RepID=A0ABT6GTQ1_MYCGU|nr:hypothetical protein [Mycolicibacterium gadium]MDG5484618.1 hypothetical protein [Mycolicibacterium gadium]